MSETQRKENPYLSLLPVAAISGLVLINKKFENDYHQVNRLQASAAQLTAIAMVENFFHGMNNLIVFIMGATGTGKSKLAIDLAKRFNGEVINSDKIQIHSGLPIVTNKVTEEECQGIPHHLLGTVEPDSDFTAADFQEHVLLAVESILGRGKLPVIAGGSNSYIEALVNGNEEFQLRYDCLFIWVDVEISTLNSFVSKRVDKMVESGLVSEVREIYDPKADNSKGIRRAIGVAELDEYFRIEGSSIIDNETKAKVLKTAIEDIKENTRLLAARQRQKIQRLKSIWGRRMYQVDATEVFLKEGVDANVAWEKIVAGPSTMKVRNFLKEDPKSGSMVPTEPSKVNVISAAPVSMAMAAATH